MTNSSLLPNQQVGSATLQLPDDLREPIRRHLEELRQHYLAMNWAQPVGFGRRPAVIVVDLALFWTNPDTLHGTHLDPVVDATCRILSAARNGRVPIFFSTFDFDPDQLPGLTNKKATLNLTVEDSPLFELDPRLQRRPNEKLLRKRHGSCFAGTDLSGMLAALSVDTVIVTGVSTSHCVYATCRDAAESFRVIVPREAVGERCQIMHMVNLLDIDIDIGDVRSCADVTDYLQSFADKNKHGEPVRSQN